MSAGCCGFLAFLLLLPLQAQVRPCAVANAPDGKMLYIACAAAACVDVLSLADRTLVGTIGVSSPPLGLALSPDGTRLYVTCPGPTSVVEKGVRDDY
jgi:DNA-binding beta-propeller fold protein YncE